MPRFPDRIVVQLVRFALCFAALWPFSAMAQHVDYARSRITVNAKQMNVPMEARFNRFTAQIAFDPSRPEAGTARIEIDVGSFDIGSADFNNEAKAKDWFDERTFPKATFVSASMRSLGAGRFEARGPLTIKGRTADVAIPFTYRKDAGGAFEGGFTIRRLQYGVGEGVWKDTGTIADEVQIGFRILFTGPAAKG